MLKRIIPIIKVTLIIWICILIPLFMVMKYMQNTGQQEAKRYIDTFTLSEGACISKNLSLQFMYSQKEIDEIISAMRHANLQKPRNIGTVLQKVVKIHPNLEYVNVYKKDGSFFASSKNKREADLHVTKELKNIEHNCLYQIEQQNDKKIVVKHTILQNLGTAKNPNEFYVQAAISWDAYESYMKNLKAGSFPRMFYIISPDCKRYVSLNILPQDSINKRAAMALGMHLTSKLQELPEKPSDISIDNVDFRIFKTAVKMPKYMKGNQFYIVIATDQTADDVLASGFDKMTSIIVSLVIVWLIICIMMARFYHTTKNHLEIAETISDSTPLAIAIFKVSDGKIMQINLSGSTLLRVTRENKEAVNMWDLFLSEDDKKYIMNAASFKINVLNYETVIQSFGGTTFWAICSASPVMIDDENYIVLAVMDINSRKEIEKKLANNAEMLEHQVAQRTADLEEKAKELEASNSLLEQAKISADVANATKSKFLTNMSNEFKTPINAIIGYAEILKEESLDRKDSVSAEDLQRIIGSAKHLLSLVNEILDLSKIEAGKTQLFFENVGVAGLVKDIEGVAMPLITEHNNSLYIEAKDIGEMYTDATKLRQCLLNLLSNAAKFTEFGKITVRVSNLVKNGKDFIEFSVIDTGSGISQEKIEHIFSSFQDAEGGGTGLGLAITKKYVEYLGGTIDVESEIGGGSKFTIKVPRICEVASNDVVLVKNNIEVEDFDEEIKKAEQEIVALEENEARSFSKKSDQNTEPY